MGLGWMRILHGTANVGERSMMKMKKIQTHTHTHTFLMEIMKIIHSNNKYEGRNDGNKDETITAIRYKMEMLQTLQTLRLVLFLFHVCIIVVNSLCKKYVYSLG